MIFLISLKQYDTGLFKTKMLCCIIGFVINIDVKYLTIVFRMGKPDIYCYKFPIFYLK